MSKIIETPSVNNFMDLPLEPLVPLPPAPPVSASFTAFALDKRVAVCAWARAADVARRVVMRYKTQPDLFHTKVKISVNRVFSTTFAKRCEAHPGDFFEFSDRNFTAIFPGRNPHIPVRPSRSKLLKPG